MTKTVKLVPLKCPRCGTVVTAAPDQVFWICPACGEGSCLDENDDLELVEVNFVPASPTRGELLWLPYWTLPAQITITKRVTFGRNEGPSRLWAQPQRFWIAAFETPVDWAIKDCRELLENPPLIECGPRAEFRPVTVDIPTAKVLAEFVMLSIEADARDWPAELHLEAQFDSPSLWVLPFQASGSGSALKPRFRVWQDGQGLVEKLKQQVRKILEFVQRGE